MEPTALQAFRITSLLLGSTVDDTHKRSDVSIKPPRTWEEMLLITPGKRTESNNHRLQNQNMQTLYEWKGHNWKIINKAKVGVNVLRLKFNGRFNGLKEFQQARDASL